MNLPEIGRHQRTGKGNQTWSLWWVANIQSKNHAFRRKALSNSDATKNTPPPPQKVMSQTFMRQLKSREVISFEKLLL